MRNCRTCHFLAKEYRESGTDRYLSFSPDDQEREKLKSDFDAIKENYSLKCHMGVWDEGVGLPKGERIDRINIKRGDSCFYYPFQKGMLFKAAVELQKREQENRELKRSVLYTRIGLWLAALGLIASVVSDFFNK